MSDWEDAPTLSPAMLADLEALARGETPPQREWWDRPWKNGEPCWAIFVGPQGDVHTLPARVVSYDATIMERDPNATTPLVEVQFEPFPVEPRVWSVLGIEGPPPLLPGGFFKLKGIVPRIVPGETW